MHWVNYELETCNLNMPTEWCAKSTALFAAMHHMHITDTFTTSREIIAIFDIVCTFYKNTKNMVDNISNYKYESYKGSIEFIRGFPKYSDEVHSHHFKNHCPVIGHNSSMTTIASAEWLLRTALSPGDKLQYNCNCVRYCLDV